jgi:hypothetical protein
MEARVADAFVVCGDKIIRVEQFVDSATVRAAMSRDQRQVRPTQARCPVT